MTLKRNASGSQVDISATVQRRASGAWVDIDVIKRRVFGVWVTAWQRIVLSDQSLTSTKHVGTATCGYRITASGTVDFMDDVSYSTLETWLAAGSASNYEARVTVTVGDLTSGTTGSWLALSSSHEWYVQRPVIGKKICEFTIEIRNASTLSVSASASISLTAERDI